MKRLRMLSACLLAILAGCASDGGQRGSGISLAEGNVASVQARALAGGVMQKSARMSPASRTRLAPTPSAATGLAGIEVSLEGTDLKTVTDANGRFSLRGEFAGETTMLFERADDRLSARLPLNVPAGGRLTLRDVTLDVATGAAQANATEVAFQGEIVALACSEGLLTLVSTEAAADDTDTYVVVLTTSSLRDRNHDPLECTDLQEGDRLKVRGAFAPDGTIGDAQLTLE